ncbi:MAG: GNAT family N-acetyltransferase [bacterium]
MNIQFKIATAKKTDSLEILELSNDLEVRNNSFNSDEISLSGHNKWFEKKIENENTIFYVVRNEDNVFMGYVRFDKENEDSCFITIHLKKEFRGKGIGTELIKQTTEKVLSESKYDKVYSYIKKNNLASLKAFIKSNFIQISDKEVINGFECYKLVKEKDK